MSEKNTLSIWFNNYGSEVCNENTTEMTLIIQQFKTG